MVKRRQKPPARRALPGEGAPTIPMSQEKWIGRVIVEWSKLEATMEDLIWHFLDLPIEFGRILTAKSSAEYKMTTLRALNDLVFGRTFDLHLQDYLKEVLDSIDLLKDDRNFIIHGTWGRLKPGGVPIVLSLRAKDSPSTVMSESFSLERMRAIYSDMAVMKWRLIRFLEAAAASHDRAREQFPLDQSTPLPNP